MRIALLTAGSRGDVQPYLALARGLERAGHPCTVVLQRPFAALAEEYGVRFHVAGGDDWPTPESMQERVRRGEFAELQGNRSGLAQLGAVADIFAQHMARLTEDALAACEGADAIGIGPLLAVTGHAIAQRLGVPYFVAALAPTLPTREFPSPIFPQRPSWLPGYNRATHWVTERLVGRIFRESATRVRRDVLRLPPYRGTVIEEMHADEPPILVGVSDRIVPRPRDWRRYFHLTGYWFVDEPARWAPPPALERFLAAGPPPVCIGFGSMASPDPAADTRMIADALARVGRRGVLLAGWAGLGAGDAELPSTLFAVPSVPHSWLFPRAAAVVHHGGAGTTAAALRAGVPQVIVPFMTDQPFWAERMRRLGVAPPPIPRPRFTAERLAAALARALDRPALRDRASELGERIRAEDGVANAVALLERELGSGARSARRCSVRDA